MQNVTRDVAIFYIFQLSYYLSLLMSHWFDVRRKDFVEMLVHHVATILLLSFSWTVNCVRIGTLILVVHDVADLFLEPAKILKYAGYQRVCDVLFLIFSFVWCVSRMIVFPFCLLRRFFFYCYCPQFIIIYFIKKKKLKFLFLTNVFLVYF